MREPWARRSGCPAPSSLQNRPARPRPRHRSRVADATGPSALSLRQPRSGSRGQGRSCRAMRNWPGAHQSWPRPPGPSEGPGRAHPPGPRRRGFPSRRAWSGSRVLRVRPPWALCVVTAEALCRAQLLARNFFSVHPLRRAPVSNPSRQ
jgi:hypothetical protein